MLIQGADIVGIKVLSKKENREIEAIDDIIYDPTINKVIGFLLTPGDTLTEPRVIMFKHIKKITPTNIIIKSEKDILLASKAVKPMSQEDDTDTFINGTNVITDDGSHLGIAKDIFFDTETGKVHEFAVADKRSGKVVRVKVKNIVTSTKDQTIVTHTEKDEKENGSVTNAIKGTVGKFLK
jgi:uncharacterized protein YrrD